MTVHSKKIEADGNNYEGDYYCSDDINYAGHINQLYPINFDRSNNTTNIMNLFMFFAIITLSSCLLLLNISGIILKYWSEL